MMLLWKFVLCCRFSASQLLVQAYEGKSIALVSQLGGGIAVRVSLLIPDQALDPKMVGRQK